VAFARRNFDRTDLSAARLRQPLRCDRGSKGNWQDNAAARDWSATNGNWLFHAARNFLSLSSDSPSTARGVSRINHQWRTAADRRRRTAFPVVPESAFSKRPSLQRQTRIDRWPDRHTALEAMVPEDCFSLKMPRRTPPPGVETFGKE